MWRESCMKLCPLNTVKRQKVIVILSHFYSVPSPCLSRRSEVFFFVLMYLKLQTITFWLCNYKDYKEWEGLSNSVMRMMLIMQVTVTELKFKSYQYIQLNYSVQVIWKSATVVEIHHFILIFRFEKSLLKCASFEFFAVYLWTWNTLNYLTEKLQQESHNKKLDMPSTELKSNTAATSWNCYCTKTFHEYYNSI